MRRKRTAILWSMVLAALLVLLASCGGQGSDPESGQEAEGTQEAAAEAALTDEELDALMQQVADAEISKEYGDYVPDEAFANAEVFGMDRDGDEGTAYVWLNTAEYVAVKGKAYEMSGAAGEVIIRFRYTAEGPKLSEIVWSEDGGAQEEWLEENYPEDCRRAAEEYEAYNEDGTSKLGRALLPEVEERMGVPVETENQLEIDTEEGYYQIVKLTETEDPETAEYQFETEVLEEGSLSDLSQ